MTVRACRSPLAGTLTAGDLEEMRSTSQEQVAGITEKPAPVDRSRVFLRAGPVDVVPPSHLTG